MKRHESYAGYEKELRTLPEELRHSLVISVGGGGHALSRYGDPIWDFSRYIHTRNKPASEKKINFSSMQFADGSRLTDPQHANLQAGTKAFLYVRLTCNSPHSGKPLSESSAFILWGRLRPLLRWMAGAGYGCFADLTSEVCHAYVEHSKTMTTWEHTKGGRKGKQLTAAVLYQYYNCVEELWHFREYLMDAPRGHPWPGQSAGSLAGVNTGVADRVVKTEQIPDRLMIKLMQGALRYVADGYGDQLLACRDVRGEGKAIDDHLSLLGLKYWQVVKEEITRLHTACYALIAGLSGMRDSEIASLETGCYYKREGWDGATYVWLKGYTYKLEDDPKPVEWMVPPVVAKAVELVRRVTAPLRDKLEKQIGVLEAKLGDICYLDPTLRQKDEEALHEMLRHRHGLFLGKAFCNDRIGILSNSAMYSRLKNFARHLNLHVQAPDLAQVLDKVKIKTGDVWPLAPHQFRRTFARYVARCILGDVRYLREHFKHWSLDMTLGYAWGDEDWLDITLIEEILSERQELQDDIVWGWIDVKTNQHLAAIGGKNIEKVRGSSLVMVATDLRTVARQLSHGYFLRGLGHSWCTEKECKGKGIYSVTECRDCENRVIDESHIPMWYGIREQQIELMMLDDCGDPIWQGALESLRYAEQVLVDIGEKVLAYPAPPKPSERRLNA
jgi:integrase